MFCDHGTSLRLFLRAANLNSPLPGSRPFWKGDAR